MAKHKIKIAVGLVLGFYLLFLVISLVIPPLFQKKIKEEQIHGPAILEPAPGSGPERVRCIDDNQEALLWRLRIIEAAQKELVFATFNLQDDESGQDIMAALLHAADRGVQVRMVVDGFNGFSALSRSKNFRALAGAPNVEACFYNPVNFLVPWRINYRMHDKYIVADEQVYILGGRNTKNLSLGDYQEKKDMDRDLVVWSEVPGTGRSLGEVRAYFEGIWALPTTKTVSGKDAPENLQALRQRYTELQTRYPQAFTETDWAGETMPARTVTLLTNPMEAHNKAPVLWKELAAFMKEGRDTIVQTPYVICNKAMYGDLYYLREGGRETTLITNSVETGANSFGCVDYLNQRKNLRQLGINLCEYQGPTSAHGKSLVIDDHISLVGSFNFDMRSAYLDTELMLAVDSPELNAHLRSIFEAYALESRTLLADGGTVTGPNWPGKELSTGKQLLYTVMRGLILPLRHLL